LHDKYIGRCRGRTQTTVFRIDFTLSPWFIPLFVAVAAAAAWWMYRNVSVELPTGIRRSLSALRFLTIFAALFLLLEPIVTKINEEKIPPTVLVLHDGSQSMIAHRDSTRVRREHPRRLKEFYDKLAAGGVNTVGFLFGASLQKLPSPDSIKYVFSSTNIAGALEEGVFRAGNQNLTAAVVISDGISNAGPSPLYSAENLGLPVYTVMLGDTVESKDLVVESVLHNELSYLNTVTPVRANLKSVGNAARQAEVRLKKGGKILQSQTVTFSGGASAKAAADFEIKLEQTGLQPYEIEIVGVPDEINYRNNSQLFFIKVLETRLKIALFAAAPHPDIGALTRTFVTDDRVEITPFIRRDDNGFYKPVPQDLSGFDMFILHQFPSHSGDRPVMDAILAQWDKKGVPMMHFVGGQYKPGVHPRQSELLALSTDRFVSFGSEAQIVFKPEYRFHSTYRFPDEKAFVRLMENGPPLLRNDSEWRPRPGTTVYATAKIKGIPLDYPLLAFQETGTSKNITFIAENIWRLRMQCHLETGNFSLFDEWITNLLQWLTTRADNRRFKVFPSKPFFQGDENVVFKGQAYDETYKPLDGVEIKTTVTGGDGKKTDYYLNELSPGNYGLDLNVFAEGAYTYEAEGVKNGIKIGTDRGEFSVGKSSIEFAQLKADVALLRQIAQRTDGKYFEGAQLSLAADDILSRPLVKPLVEYRKSTAGFRRFVWPLLLILLTLSVEWIARKRYGMI
jgi:hypothetical protein